MADDGRARCRRSTATAPTSWPRSRRGPPRAVSASASGPAATARKPTRLRMSCEFRPPQSKGRAMLIGAVIAICICSRSSASCCRGSPTTPGGVPTRVSRPAPERAQRPRTDRPPALEIVRNLSARRRQEPFRRQGGALQVAAIGPGSRPTSPPKKLKSNQGARLDHRRKPRRHLGRDHDLCGKHLPDRGRRDPALRHPSSMSRAWI